MLNDKEILPSVFEFVCVYEVYLKMLYLIKAQRLFVQAAFIFQLCGCAYVYFP